MSVFFVSVHRGVNCHVYAGGDQHLARGPSGPRSERGRRPVAPRKLHARLHANVAGPHAGLALPTGARVLAVRIFGAVRNEQPVKKVHDLITLCLCTFQLLLSHFLRNSFDNFATCIMRA